MIIYKIKFKSYIADLYLPQHRTNKIIVLVPGLPKSSNIDKLVKTFLDLGCIILYPNFSGTYDSGGTFDAWNSIKDVREFIKCARQHEVTELYYDKKIKLGLNNELILVGMSYGAIVSLFAFNKHVDKLMFLSPALLFNQDDINKIVKFNFKNQMSFLLKLLKRALPYTYRIKSFYLLEQFLYGKTNQLSRQNIESLFKNIKSPTMVIHGKVDNSVPWQITNELRKSVQNKKIEWKFFKMGHSNSSYTKTALKKISEFIKS